MPLSPRAAAALELCLGFAAGGVAVRARWPFEVDVLEVTELAPWRDPAAGALLLGLALASAAMRPVARHGQPAWLWLAGVLVGVGTGLFDAATHVGSVWPWLALGAAAAYFAQRRGSTRIESADEAPISADSSRRSTGYVAVFALASGITTALIALARLAARTMPDAPPDHSVRALGFTLLLCVGAVAFGRPFTVRPGGDATWTETERRRALGALTIAAYGSFAALVVVGGLTTPRGLRALMRRFDLDVAASGTFEFDLVVALATFVLPAFALGAALHILRARRAWLALAFGAAAGVLHGSAVPALEPGALASDASAPVLGSARLVLQGLLVAGSGAVLGSLGTSGAARVLGCAAGLSAVALGALLNVSPVRVMKAFERFPAAPIAIAEGASGQYLIDPGGAGLRRATLDQRALAPNAEYARLDRDTLVASFGLVSAAQRVDGVAVLFVGPLTPGRVMALSELGATRVDRTAGYWRDLAALEAGLDVRVPELATEGAPFAGRVVSLEGARAALEGHAYDLVIVPPIEGNRGRFEVPESWLGSTGAVCVVWLAAADDAARAVDAPRVLLAANGAEHLAIGLVRGAAPNDVPTPDAAPWLPLAPPHGSLRALQRLRLTEDSRGAENERELAARLARGARGTVWEDLTEGLQMHFAAQRPSSPFETAAQRIELDREALDRLFAHGTLGPPDLFTRGLWEGLVETLRARREVGLTYDLIEPLAELWAPWPAGALALAWADTEELDPAGAAERLAPVAAQLPGDRALALGYAEALRAAGRPADAASALARLIDVVGPERGLRKALARALIEAQDPDGRTLAQELLREDPEDREVWALLGPLQGASPGALLGPPRER